MKMVKVVNKKIYMTASQTICIIITCVFSHVYNYFLWFYKDAQLQPIYGTQTQYGIEARYSARTHKATKSDREENSTKSELRWEDKATHNGMATDKKYCFNIFCFTFLVVVAHIFLLQLVRSAAALVVLPFRHLCSSLDLYLLHFTYFS